MSLRRLPFAALLALALAFAPAARAALPTGYLIWSKGRSEDPASRKIYRLTLPDRADERALTTGEDVEPQVSPDGRWVAYAKAKFPGGSDYHDFKAWKIYLVSIHGAGDGRKEIKIDDDGYWPSWSKSGALFFSQADGTHSRVVRVELDDRGRVQSRTVVFSSRERFAGFGEVNEVVVAPDERWFAARTRGNTLQNGVTALTLDPPSSNLLARAGDVGCMPKIAPDGSFALIAGAGAGIRWGHGPHVPGRQSDQMLVPVKSPQHLGYHPGIASDGRWIVTGVGTDPNHNAGRWDLAVLAFDPTSMSVSGEELLTTEGFNGFPDLWVGAPSAPPMPNPEILDFRASRYTVSPGESVELGWSTFGADEIRLGDKIVAADGSETWVATATTTHTLLARSTRLGTSETRTLVVTVNATPLPVAITRFAAEPDQIETGRSTRLSWQAENATTLTLDGEPVPPMGEREVTPLASRDYVLVAMGHAGPVEARAPVRVTAQSSGLLPDRGGFQCTAAPHGRAALPPLVLLAALALARRRRR